MMTRFIALILSAFLIMGAAQTTPKPTTTAGAAQSTPKQPTAAQSANKPLTAAGLWEEADDQGVVGAWFLFAEKDGVFSGRLVKMFKKGDEPLVETCSKCTGDQKNARMLGLTIVKDMKRTGLKYKDGSILDPRDGSVYHAEMELSPDGKQLSVRGYLLMPLLGQTQVWNRLPDDAIKPADIPKEVLAPAAADE
jgi:uncharacterized protein (DUF2147 family)